MPRSYEQFYQRKREYLSEQVDAGEVHPDDAEAIFEVCDAFDEDNLLVDRPTWPDAPSNLTQFRSKGTLANWCYFLTTYAQTLRLLETTGSELNRQAQQWLDDDLAKGTIRAYQNAARIFYRYHDDVGVDHDSIVVFDAQDTSINPRDMLSREEIHAVREAVGHPRDATVVDLLLYCGMRNNALRTLRIKDVDVEGAVWYFNTDASGLKHIYMAEAPRPLLGAVASVRDWLSYHPYSDDGDAYLITAKPNYSKVTPHDPVDDRTISRVTNGIKDEAGIDKPLHPHMMRHNFVSICKRNYDMDDTTIKWLIGHSPDSNVMERTYSHLSGEDFLQKAEVAAGVADEDDDSPFTPEFCQRCGEPVTQATAAACANCGMTFRPDAVSTQERINDAMYNHRVDADDEVGQQLDDMRKLINGNPLLKQIVLDGVSDKELRQALDE